MKRLQPQKRKKVVESSLRTYFVYVETDLEAGYHKVQIYDEDPEAPPEEVKFLWMKVQLDSPPTPVIERIYSLQVDLQEKIEGLIHRYEYPERMLEKLDEWDGVVRPPQSEPVINDGEEIPVNDGEEEERVSFPNNIVRIRDWRTGTMYYDRVKRRWLDPEEIDELEELDDLEESG